MRGIVYEVMVFDSAMDFAHGLEYPIRELHIPKSQISVYVSQGRVNVFTPEPDRYLASKRKGSRLRDSKSPKKIRNVSLTDEEFALILEFQRLEEKARSVAERHLEIKRLTNA